MSGADAIEKIEAGASLVQLYSGMIYKGPSLVGEVASALS
jgi:dihydroorotate dehydrogenase